MAPPTLFKFRREFYGSIPARDLFRKLVLDGDKNIPKTIPQDIISIESSGSTKEVKFAQGIEPQSLKLSVDAPNDRNWTYTFSIKEGVTPPNKIKFISYQIKLEECSEESCKGTIWAIYNPEPDVVIHKDEITPGKEEALSVALFKAACLLAQPGIEEYIYNN